MNIGDRVTRRGSEGTGTIIDMKVDWVSIKWDEHPIRKPMFCHSRELEKEP